MRKRIREIQRLALSSEIVKCSHCKKILSSKDFESHTCDLPLKECRRIEVVYFQDVSYKNKKLINGWGVDGVLYTFEVVSRKPIPIILPIGDEISHEKKSKSSDGDFTEPLKPR